MDGIVDAAVRIADAEGLEAVSMARVAKELGFTTMSLYRYVASKDELLQLMWNASAQGAEELEVEGTSWRERLRSWALVQREAHEQHPWITQMPMAAPPLAPNSLTFVERGLETLDDGDRGADKLGIIGVISSYTFSEARMANDAGRVPRHTPTLQQARARCRNGPSTAFSVSSSTRSTTRGCTESRGPAPSVMTPPPPKSSAHLFGLDLILDGVQALIEQKGPEGSRRERRR